MTSYCVSYLAGGAIGEGGREEGGYDLHHTRTHVLLQDVLVPCGRLAVVRYLQEEEGVVGENVVRDSGNGRYVKRIRFTPN